MTILTTEESCIKNIEKQFFYIFKKIFNILHL